MAGAAVTPPPGTRTDLSVVVPVYECADSLSLLHERLERTLATLVESFEVIFVDDRSSDGAWPILKDLAGRSSNVTAIRLSRNFGQHAAITAGLAEARGRWSVVMDCDLQDLPEEIPALYRKALEGYDVVFGRRLRRHEGWLRKAATRSYLWLANRFLKMNIQGEYGSFSIISDRVRTAFLSLRDKDRHYLFILYWLGFEHSSVDVSRSARRAGSSAYTFHTLVRHALDGVFFQTTVLLKWIIYFGFALSLLGAALSAAFIAIYFAGNPYPGWTSLAVLLLIVGGFIIMSTGVTGLYIGKIFDQVKERPLYVIDEKVRVGKLAGDGPLEREAPAVGAGAPPAA
jgi:polyisoprenyl-phosphate glycosyltransferase